MLAEMLSVVTVAGETMLKLVPISIAFGIVFAFLTSLVGLQSGPPLVAQAGDRHRHLLLVLDSTCGAFRTHRLHGDGRRISLRDLWRRRSDEVL